MTILQALILGIVEGITEFLPISSTGHLIIVSHLLNIQESDFLKSFLITIQLGGITAVIILYFKSFLNIEIIKRLIVGFIPTGIVGLLAYSLVKQFLDSTVIVAWALLIGGIILIILELVLRNTDGYVESSSRMQVQIISEISYSKAVLIGLCQALALIPGVSRSAATIAGGLLLGVPRVIIVEFSFLLAVPTMAAATGLDLVKNYHLFSGAQFGILAVGFISSCLVALAAITFLLRFVRTSTFIPFGIYRIIAAIAIFALLSLSVL